MKALYDKSSFRTSKLITQAYSTSFSLAVGMLAPSIRNAIYSIYGFVRLADEIVDTFHDYPKESLLQRFERDLYQAVEDGISLNPILQAFQITVHKYGITEDLIDAFIESMRADLTKNTYKSKSEYDRYIYGSADVVGLMCLKVFVMGDDEKFQALKPAAMRLGSAFQKVNFLRDLGDDTYVLDRNYFPDIHFGANGQLDKSSIIHEIEEDFRWAREGIVYLPAEAKFGVYTAYIYYKRLLRKLKRAHMTEIMDSRIRISNPVKLGLLAQSFVRIKLNRL